MGFGRLFMFLLVSIIGQQLISYGMIALAGVMGINNPMLIMLLIDLAVGFFFAFLYIPSGERKGCLKRQEFYKYAGIFALIFMLIDFLTMGF